MNLFGKSYREKELEKEINKLKITNESLQYNFEKQKETLKIKEKTIDLLMKINFNHNDSTNIEYLVKYGFGDEKSIKNWFQNDKMKNTLLGRFDSMLKAHYQMYQGYGDHLLTDKVSQMLNNELFENRINELAEINSALYLLASFEDWQRQFLMLLEDSGIEYYEHEEYLITSCLVYETMFRATTERMK